jgi:hypothetical protein
MFPMSKVFKSIVGLAIITSSIGLAATPAKAESKPAQCQRFGQALSALSQHLVSARRNPNLSRDANTDRLLVASEKGLKQLQSRQFSDPKIRGFQQTTLNTMTRFHNNIITLVEVSERNDRPAVDRALQQLSTSLKPLDSLSKQVDAYCGRSK